MTGGQRLEIRLRRDAARRRVLKIKAKPAPRMGRCLGSTYTGDRCYNTAADESGYCYAHRQAEEKCATLSADSSTREERKLSLVRAHEVPGL